MYRNKWFCFSEFCYLFEWFFSYRTSKDSTSYERVFYGITKEGKPLFSNNNYIISFDSTVKTRKYSENIIITINNGKHDEYLMSIENGDYMELYDLNKKKVIDKCTVSTLIGKDTMDSYIQTGINYFENNKYYLFYGYVTKDTDFYLKKLYLDCTSISKVSIIPSNHIGDARGQISSCYMTNQKYISCLIMQKSNSFKANLKAYI